MHRITLRHIAGIGLALLSLTFAASAFAQDTTIRVVGPQGLPAVDQCLIVGSNGNATVPTRYHWGQSNQEGTCGFAQRAALLANGQGTWTVSCLSWAPDRCYMENRRVRNGIEVVKCLWSDRLKSNAVTLNEGACTYIAEDGRKMVDSRGLWIIDRHSAFTPLRPFDNTDTCLIFNNRGYQEYPTIYRWNDDPNDRRYCGLGSEAALFKTGQALFAVEDTFYPSINPGATLKARP